MSHFFKIFYFFAFSIIIWEHVLSSKITIILFTASNFEDNILSDKSRYHAKLCCVYLLEDCVRDAAVVIYLNDCSFTTLTADSLK